MTPAALNLTIIKGITFGPVLITCKDSGGAAVNLTGWSVTADARQSPSKAVAFSLAPQITDAAAGQITVGFSDEQTNALPAGTFRWDLVLERPTGERL
ncbi:MAG: hypothetical protein WC069_07200, partial [Candidatus Shapirobacteria bacterium]